MPLETTQVDVPANRAIDLLVRAIAHPGATMEEIEVLARQLQELAALALQAKTKAEYLREKMEEGSLNP